MTSIVVPIGATPIELLAVPACEFWMQDATQDTSDAYPAGRGSPKTSP